MMTSNLLKKKFDKFIKWVVLLYTVNIKYLNM